ncbi:RNA-guided endonuclease IscB [Streptomyces sp. NPDC046939]|uniref:RNA-guided endonuclease IscB n=1 Tax=Streptomyces sp. NPDC046939 TaxID=3155376 RepID=UPI0033F73D67
MAKGGQPLMPCHPARARELLRRGRAVVARQTPFTIRLRDRTRAASEVDGVQLRIDPGSRGTGMALTDEKREAGQDGEKVVARRGLIGVELRHRGDRIHLSLRQRAGYRRRRRSANLRYRAPRSDNRTRPDGWLPPSVQHRVDTMVSLATRFCRFAPVTEIHVESAAFDTHSLSAGWKLIGEEHQRGPSAGTEIRTHLRERWGNACAYCDAVGVPLNVEHLHPRSRGGSDRAANLVLACVPCNHAKGAKPLSRFLAHDPERLARITSQVRASLRDAAAMNSLGGALLLTLTALGRPVRSWPAVLTHTHRTAAGLDKSHTIDALVVGRPGVGFPRLRRARGKKHFGYVTGDLVRAEIPSGRWAGVWTGRVSVRARGQPSLATPGGRVNVSHQHLRLLQRGDGYAYELRPEVASSMSPKTG